VVEGVCYLLRSHVASYQPVKPSRWARENPAPPYADAADLATRTFRATLRPWDHVREVGASGVLHWVTHAEALVTLEDLEYADLSRKGYAAHQMNVHRPVQGSEGRAPERPPVDWLRPDYWESDAPRRLLSGSWLGGHAFKLPHSLFRLLRRVDDPALRASALHRATLLPVPFEG
jgi:hypothetical protein